MVTCPLRANRAGARLCWYCLTWTNQYIEGRNFMLTEVIESMDNAKIAEIIDEQNEAV